MIVEILTVPLVIYYTDISGLPFHTVDAFCVVVTEKYCKRLYGGLPSPVL